MNNIIELKNVYKHYITNKKNTILKKINYKFKKGLIYSLVGPSGSGKSTLLNLLSLIDKPSSGEILINDSIIKFILDSNYDEKTGLQVYGQAFTHKSINEEENYEYEYGN